MIDWELAYVYFWEQLNFNVIAGNEVEKLLDLLLLFSMVAQQIKQGKQKSKSNPQSRKIKTKR